MTRALHHSLLTDSSSSTLRSVHLPTGGAGGAPLTAEDTRWKDKVNYSSVPTLAEMINRPHVFEENWKSKTGRDSETKFSELKLNLNLNRRPEPPSCFITIFTENHSELQYKNQGALMMSLLWSDLGASLGFYGDTADSDKGITFSVKVHLHLILSSFSLLHFICYFIIIFLKASIFFSA